jgi:hypothetical protein
LKRRYLILKDHSDTASKQWRNILERFDPDTDLYQLNILQNSYTEDKDKIYLCIRDSRGRTHDINTITVVFIHELAHIATNEQNHTPEFWSNYKMLYDTAVSCHVIDLYASVPDEYCGVRLNGQLVPWQN